MSDIKGNFTIESRRRDLRDKLITKVGEGKYKERTIYNIIAAADFEALVPMTLDRRNRPLPVHFDESVFKAMHERQIDGVRFSDLWAAEMEQYLGEDTQLSKAVQTNLRLANKTIGIDIPKTNEQDSVKSTIPVKEIKSSKPGVTMTEAVSAILNIPEQDAKELLKKTPWQIEEALRETSIDSIIETLDEGEPTHAKVRANILENMIETGHDTNTLANMVHKYQSLNLSEELRKKWLSGIDSVDFTKLASDTRKIEGAGKELYGNIRTEINQIKHYKTKMKDLYVRAKDIGTQIIEVQARIDLLPEEKSAMIIESYADSFDKVAFEVANLQKEAARTIRHIPVTTENGEILRTPIGQAVNAFIESNKDVLPSDTVSLIRKELDNYYGDDKLIYNARNEVPAGIYDIEKPGSLTGFAWGEHSIVKDDPRLTQLERIALQLDTMVNGQPVERIEYENQPGVKETSARRYDDWREKANRDIAEYISEDAKATQMGTNVGQRTQNVIAQQQIEGIAKELNIEAPKIPKTWWTYTGDKDNSVLTPIELAENMEFEDNLKMLLEASRESGDKFGREGSPLENFRRAVTENILVKSGVDQYVPVEGLTEDIINKNLTDWSRYVGKDKYLYRFGGDKLAYKLKEVNGIRGIFVSEAIDPSKTKIEFDIANNFDIKGWVEEFNDKNLSKAVRDKDAFISNLLQSNWSYIEDGKYADNQNIVSQVLAQHTITEGPHGQGILKVVSEVEKLLQGRLGYTYDRNPELYLDATQDLTIAVMQAQETSKSGIASSEEILRHYYQLQADPSAYAMDTSSWIEPGDEFYRSERVWHTGRMATVEIIKEMEKAGIDTSNHRDIVSRLVGVREYITNNAGKEGTVHWGKMGYLNTIRAISKKELEQIAKDYIHGGKMVQDNATRKEFRELSFESIVESYTDQETGQVIGGRTYEEALLQNMAEDYQEKTGRKWNKVKRKEDIENIFKAIRDGKDDYDKAYDSLAQRMDLSSMNAEEVDALISKERNAIVDKRLRQVVISRLDGRKVSKEELTTLVEKERKTDINRQNRILSLMDVNDSGSIGRTEQEMLATEYTAIIKSQNPEMGYLDLLEKTASVTGTHNIQAAFNPTEFIESLLDEEGRNALNREHTGSYVVLQSMAMMNKEDGFNFTVTDEHGRQFVPVFGEDGDLLAQYDDHSKLISRTGRGVTRAEDLGHVRPVAFVRSNIEETSSTVIDSQDKYVKSLGAQYDALVRMRDNSWLKQNPADTFMNLEAVLAGHKAVVLDFETTGLLDHPDLQILEIATMDIEAPDGKPKYGEAESILIKPLQKTLDRMNKITDSIYLQKEIMNNTARVPKVGAYEHIGQFATKARELQVKIENTPLDSVERAESIDALKKLQKVVTTDDVMFMRNIAKFSDPEWARKDVKNLDKTYTVDKLFNDTKRAIQRLDSEGVDLEEGLSILKERLDDKAIVGHNVASFDIPMLTKAIDDLPHDIINREIDKTKNLLEDTTDKDEIKRYQNRIKALDDLLTIQDVGEVKARIDTNAEVVKNDARSFNIREGSTRFNFTKLAEPQINPWYTEGTFNRVAGVLGVTDIQFNNLLNSDNGVEEIRNRLSTVDYDSLKTGLQSTIDSQDTTSYAKGIARRRLKIVNGLSEAGVAPTDMVIDRVPLPPDDIPVRTNEFQKAYNKLHSVNYRLTGSLGSGDSTIIERDRVSLRNSFNELMRIATPPDTSSNNRWVTSASGIPSEWDIVGENEILDNYSKTLTGFADEANYWDDLKSRMQNVDDITEHSKNLPLIDTLPLFRWTKPGSGHSIEKVQEHYGAAMEKEGWVPGTHHIGKEDVQTEGYGLIQMINDYKGSKGQIDNFLEPWQQGDMFAVISQEGTNNIPIGEYEFVKQEGPKVIAKELDTGNVVNIDFDNQAKGQRWFTQNVKEINTPGEFNEQLLLDDVNRAIQKGLNKGIAGIDYLKFQSGDDSVDSWNKAYNRLNQIQGELDTVDRYVQESMTDVSGVEKDELRRQAGQMKQEYIQSLSPDDQALLLNRHKFNEIQSDIINDTKLSPRQLRKVESIASILDSDLFRDVITPKMQEIEDTVGSGKITRNDAEEMVRDINNAIKENVPKRKVEHLSNLGNITYKGKRVGQMHLDLANEATIMRSLYSSAEIIGEELFPTHAENDAKAKAINEVLLPWMKRNGFSSAERLEDVANYIMRNKDKLSLSAAEITDWSIPVGKGTQVYVDSEIAINKAFNERLSSIHKRQIDQGIELHEGHDLAERVIRNTREMTQAEYGVIPGMRYNIGTRGEDVNVVMQKIGRPLNGVDGMSLEEIHENFLRHQETVEGLTDELLETTREMDIARQERIPHFNVRQAAKNRREIFNNLIEAQKERNPYLNALSTVADLDAGLDSVSDLTLRAREMLGQVRVDQPTGEERITKWDYSAVPEGSKASVNYTGFRLTDIPDEALTDYIKYQNIGGHERERGMVGNYLQQKGYKAYDEAGQEMSNWNDWRRQPPPDAGDYTIQRPEQLSEGDEQVRQLNEEAKQGKVTRADSPKELVAAMNEESKRAVPESVPTDDKGFFRTLFDEAKTNGRLKWLMGLAGGLAVAGFSLRQLSNQRPFEPEEEGNTESRDMSSNTGPMIDKNTYMEHPDNTGGAQIKIKTKPGNIPHDQIGNIVSETINSELPGVDINVNLTDNTSNISTEYVRSILNQYVSHGYVVNRGE